MKRDRIQVNPEGGSLLERGVYRAPWLNSTGGPHYVAVAYDGRLIGSENVPPDADAEPALSRLRDALAASDPVRLLTLVR